MSFSSHLLILSLFIWLCSSDDMFLRGGGWLVKETSAGPDPTGQTSPPTPTESVTSETSAGPDPTGQTSPITPTDSVTSETSAGPDPTGQTSPPTPTDSVTSETSAGPDPTGQTSPPTPTESVTSETGAGPDPTDPPSSPTPTDSVTSETSPGTGASTPSSQPPTTNSVTVTPLDCRNGGTFNGFNCTCLTGFNGELCQFLENLEPVNFNGSVEVTVEISETYNDNYENEESAEYKEFVEKFIKEMVEFYRKSIPNTRDVVVTKVSRGEPLATFSDNTMREISTLGEAMANKLTNREQSFGVNVIHEVILEIQNANPSQHYNNSFTALEKALTELQSCTDCAYNISKSSATPQEIDFHAACKNSVDNPDEAEIYAPVQHGDKVICVTPCDRRHGTPKICHNKGTCRVFTGAGALCECQNVNSTWYLGEDCHLPIQRTAFYIGLSVTLTLLLVTVGALATHTLINKKRQTQKKDMKDKLVNRWLNEDFEWSRSNSPLDASGKRDYQNPSFTPENASVFKNDPYIARSVPLHQLTQASQPTDFRQSSLQWPRARTSNV